MKKQKEADEARALVRARMMSNFYALCSLVVIFLTVLALLSLIIIPVQGMADATVSYLIEGKNKPWLQLGSVLFLFVGGYYFYSNGQFWIAAICFWYLAFLF